MLDVNATTLLLFLLGTYKVHKKMDVSLSATKERSDAGACTNILQSATRLVSAGVQSVLDSPLSVSRSVRGALSRNVNERQNVCRLGR